MQEFTLIHVVDKNKPDEVLLVTKSSYGGKLLLIGNKVNENEEPEIAAINAFKDDTGYVEFDKLTYCGRIEKYNSKVYCFTVTANTITQNKKATNLLHEPVEWYKISSVINDKKLNNELRVTIPLLHNGLKNWLVISDNNNITVKLNQL